jgi:hypothetical protein
MMVPPRHLASCISTRSLSHPPHRWPALLPGNRHAGFALWLVSAVPDNAASMYVLMLSPCDNASACILFSCFFLGCSFLKKSTLWELSSSSLEATCIAGVFSPIGSLDCYCCACQLRPRSLEATRDVPCSSLHPTFDAYPAGFPIFPFLSVSWLPLFWSWMARRLDQTIARSCELCNGSVASPLSSPSSHSCASPLFDSLC